VTYIQDAAFVSGLFADAVAHYTAALVHERSAAVLCNRSAALLRCGDAAGAEEDAAACLLLRPGWAKACYRRGSALHALGRFEEAALVHFEGVQAAPDDVDIARAFRAAVEAGRAQAALLGSAT